MTFRVELTQRAERDVDEIVGWLAEESAVGARSWSDRFEEVLSQLESSASAAPPARESGYRGAEIRQRVFKTRRGKPYRLLFTISGDTVFILHVRGPGQDLVPPDELSR